MNFNRLYVTTLFFIFCNSIQSLLYGQQKFDTLYVAKYQSDKQCAISYTFDDGLLEHFTLVYPKFEKLGFKATFWVNGKTIEDYAKGIPTEKPRVSWNDLKTMAEHGHEISNHGWLHKNLVKFPLEEGRIDIERNDSAILANIGERPVTYCYPNNSKSPEAIKMASANRVGTRTKQFSVGSKASFEYLNKRLDTLLVTHDWGVTMTHGITYGYDAFKQDSVLWNHLERVKKLESNIWVATFRDVAAYTTEQQNIKLEIIRKPKTWIIKPALSLDKRLFNFPLTMVLLKKDAKKVVALQDGKSLKIEVRDGKTMFGFDPNGGEIKIRIE